MVEDLPNNSFPDRMKLVIKLFDNKEKLGKLCGISPVMLGKYESGSEPSREKLVAIANATGISIEWLAAGMGEMRRAAGEHPKREDVEREGSGMARGRGSRRSDDQFCYIPMYNVSASAGGGAVVDRERVVDVLAFKTEWIRTQLNATEQDLYLIHVEGESMEPTLRPGDVILVDHREASALPRDGIYVVRMDDTLLVKRLQRLPGSHIRVTSDNTAYQPFTVNLIQERNEMEIVGRVVWCGRRM